MAICVQPQLYNQYTPQWDGLITISFLTVDYMIVRLFNIIIKKTIHYVMGIV